MWNEKGAIGGLPCISVQCPLCRTWKQEERDAYVDAVCRRVREPEEYGPGRRFLARTGINAPAPLMDILEVPDDYYIYKEFVCESDEGEEEETRPPQLPEEPSNGGSQNEAGINKPSNYLESLSPGRLARDLYSDQQPGKYLKLLRELPERVVSPVPWVKVPLERDPKAPKVGPSGLGESTVSPGNVPWVEGLLDGAPSASGGPTSQSVNGPPDMPKGILLGTFVNPCGGREESK